MATNDKVDKKLETQDVRRRESCSTASNEANAERPTGELSDDVREWAKGFIRKYRVDFDKLAEN